MARSLEVPQKQHHNPYEHVQTVVELLEQPLCLQRKQSFHRYVSEIVFWIVLEDFKRLSSNEAIKSSFTAYVTL